MLNKLARKKNLILTVYSSVWLIFLIIALIFDNSENKVNTLILSPIIPIITYVFARLNYKIVSINASLKTLRFFYYFFLIGGSLGTVLMIVEFIRIFPNNVSPTLGACGALIVATLDSVKKNIETDEKK